MLSMVTVNISDMKIAGDLDTLVTYALGSCVGICLFDPIRKIGALGHIMLPNKTESSDNLFKFADTCIPVMLDGMQKLGCSKTAITAKIAGGAQMFQIGDSSIGNIGARNVRAVKETLALCGVRMIGEDTGSNYGRTVFFDTGDGSVKVKSFVKDLVLL